MPDPIHRSFTTSWCSNGGTITVTTPCEGLTQEACREAHDLLVAEMKIDFPENC